MYDFVFGDIFYMQDTHILYKCVVNRSNLFCWLYKRPKRFCQVWFELNIYPNFCKLLPVIEFLSISIIGMERLILLYNIQDFKVQAIFSAFQTL